MHPVIMSKYTSIVKVTWSSGVCRNKILFCTYNTHEIKTKLVHHNRNKYNKNCPPFEHVFRRLHLYNDGSAQIDILKIFGMSFPHLFSWLLKDYRLQNVPNSIAYNVYKIIGCCFNCLCKKFCMSIQGSVDSNLLKII